MARIKANHVLTMTIYNYAKVELGRHKEGFTKDFDKKKFEALQEKVASTVELLLDDLDL